MAYTTQPNDHLVLVPCTSTDRFVKLASGEIDLLVRTTSATLGRNTVLDVSFSRPLFYDGACVRACMLACGCVDVRCVDVNEAGGVLSLCMLLMLPCFYYDLWPTDVQTHIFFYAYTQARAS